MPRLADDFNVYMVRIEADRRGVTLVLSHFAPPFDSIDDETWRAPVARYLKGEIIVGKAS